MLNRSILKWATSLLYIIDYIRPVTCGVSLKYNNSYVFQRRKRAMSVHFFFIICLNVKYENNKHSAAQLKQFMCVLKLTVTAGLKA